MERRGFVTKLILGFGSLFFLGVKSVGLLFPENSAFRRALRPPGTENENDFLKKCTRCRACANVCEAGCIRFFTLSESLRLAGTPYLEPRKRACNLCMNCTQVCPTGALKPIEKDIKEIAAGVKMGGAVVVESNCLSFNGRICGVCHDACPVSGAIKLESPAKPIVDLDLCIGCGRCEERCPQYPSAIIVKRKEDPIYG